MVIKAVIFDVGGVLEWGKISLKRLKRHHSKSVHLYMANKMGVGIDDWFDAIDSYYAKSIEGKIPRKEVLERIAFNLKVPVNKLVYVWKRAYKKFMVSNLKLYALAKKLKKDKYVVGILSDQWYLSKDVLMPKEKTKIFSPVIVSCDVGMRKPSVKIYRLLLDKLRKKNIKPSEIVFIDNREWNLVPARKLKIKTVLFRNNLQVRKELRNLGIDIK